MVSSVIQANGDFDKTVTALFVNSRRGFLNGMSLAVFDQPTQEGRVRFGNRDFGCLAAWGTIGLDHCLSSYRDRLHRPTDSFLRLAKSVGLLFYSVVPMIDWNSDFVKLKCGIPSVSKRGCNGR